MNIGVRNFTALLLVIAVLLSSLSFAALAQEEEEPTPEATEEVTEDDSTEEDTPEEEPTEEPVEEEKEEPEVIEGSYEVSGENIVVNKEIENDAFISGNRIEVSNVVDDNLFLAGQDVRMGAEVGGAAFIAGKALRITGEVDENLFAAGQDILITEAVDGDAYIAAGNLILRNDIDGDLRVTAGSVFISDVNVDEDVEINARQVKIHPEAEFEGIVKINGDEIDWEDEDAKSAYFSEDIPEDLDDLPAAEVASLSVLSIIASLITLLGHVLVIYLLFRLFPVKSEGVLRNMQLEGAEIFSNLKYGALALIITPLLAVILLVSVIGIPVLTVMVVLAVLVALLAMYYTYYKVGQEVVSRIQPNANRLLVNAFVGVLIMTVVYVVLGLIPSIGAFLVFVVQLALFIWAVGAIVRIKLRNLKLANEFGK